MARSSTYLIAAGLLCLLFLAAPAWAQNGSCPDYTNAIGAPFGFYPPMLVCDDGSFDSELIIDESMPCGVGVRTRWAFIGEQPGFYVIFPPNQSLPSGWANIDFYGAALNIARQRTNTTFFVTIESYNASNIKIDSLTAHSSSADFIVLPNGDRLFKFPRGPLTLSLQVAPGGYLYIRADKDEGYFTSFWEVYGMRVYDSAGMAPPLCSIPGHQTPTPAPTLTPSITPTPSETPFGASSPTPSLTPTTTRTPSATPTIHSFPTVTPFTVTPTAWPTPTPQPLYTMPPRSTPTEIPLAEMPALTMPTLEFPGVGGVSTAAAIEITLEPNATNEAVIDAVATQSAETMAMVTRWYTTTQAALGYTDTGLTTTTTVSTPIQIASELTANLSWPIRFIRSGSIYLPNLWPFLLFLILAVIWIFFVVISKWAVAIVAETLDIIRRIKQMLPFQ